MARGRLWHGSPRARDQAAHRGLAVGGERRDHFRSRRRHRARRLEVGPAQPRGRDRDRERRGREEEARRGGREGVAAVRGLIHRLEQAAADAGRLRADEQDGLSEEPIEHASRSDGDRERHVSGSDPRLEGDRVRSVDDDDDLARLGVEGARHRG